MNDVCSICPNRLKYVVGEYSCRCSCIIPQLFDRHEFPGLLLHNAPYHTIGVFHPMVVKGIGSDRTTFTWGISVWVNSDGTEEVTGI